jgi:hypothetical protein
MPLIKIGWPACPEVSNGDVACGLRLDHVPSLTFTIAVVWIHGATYNLLGSSWIWWLILVYINGCPLASSWGSSKDDWCEACEILWASWEKYMLLSLSLSHHVWKCFPTVLHARIGTLQHLGSQPVLILPHAAILPGSSLKELGSEGRECLH